MELIRGLHNLRSEHRGCVVTIGNFDGVHRGHRAVVKQTARAAKEQGLPTVLMTFEPQPQEFFAGDRAPARLTRFREKLMALREMPLDRVLCLRFDRKLAAWPAEDFIDRFLVRGLGVRHVVVGDDFRFGHHRQGDLALLKAMGARHGFTVASMATCRVLGSRVSSTRVREALAEGDLSGVETLLGRRFSLCGRIVYGDGRGRGLGFPTANIPLRRISLPLSGVFTVVTHGILDRGLPGVANVGTRPTIGGKRGLLEVHLLEHTAHLYGRSVQVEFHHKLREERRFDSVAELKDQITRDAERARSYFGL